jgi:RHS repeat-associated protein
VTNTISQYEYGYDGAGNRRWVKRANGRGDVYRYDATDQLTNVLYEAINPDTTPSAWTNEVRYVFDAAGNRESVTRTHSGTVTYAANALNQYTQVGGVALGWDANGNPTNVVENGVTLALTYDRENRLVRVDTGTVTVTNTYDAFHRLVERATAGGKLRFVYDNRWRVIAEYDQNDTLVNRYVYGPEIDEPVRLTRGAGRFYYHAAALGTVTELTGWLGHVRERYEYDVYGQPTIRDAVGNLLTNSAFGNRFLFQGRDRDPVTGLYNFRYRTYSPSLERFLQADPIRELGGWNFYCFLENNAMNRLDPLGLSASGAGNFDGKPICPPTPCPGGASKIPQWQKSNYPSFAACVGDNTLLPPSASLIGTGGGTGIGIAGAAWNSAILGIAGALIGGFMTGDLWQAMIFCNGAVCP